MILQPLSADAVNEVSQVLSALVSNLAPEMTPAPTEQDPDAMEPTGWEHAKVTDLSHFAEVWRWAIDKAEPIDTRNGAVYGNLNSILIHYGGDHYEIRFNEAAYEIELRKAVS